jgi:MFS family permease
MRAALSDPRFRRFYAGQVLSTFGDNALYLALAIWAKQLTGSTPVAGLVFFAFIGATTVAAPATGYIVDRVRRRPFLIGVNLASGLCVLGLLAVHGSGDLWILFAVAIASGVSTSALGAGKAGLLKDLLPDEALGGANAALRTATDGIRLLSPLVGAGLFAVAGGGAVAAVDAATFFIAAIALLSIHVDESEPEPSTGSLRQEALAGLHHIRDTGELRRVVVLVTLAFVTVGFFETAMIAIVDEGLHRSPSFLGVLESVGGIGAIVGGLTAVRTMTRFGEPRTIGLGMLVIAGGATLLATDNVVIVVVASAITWLGVPWLVVAFSTLSQRLTPPRLQGRVSAAVDVTLGTTQAMSVALGAALMGVVDHRVLLFAIALSMLASGLRLFRWRPVTPPLAARQSVTTP